MMQVLGIKRVLLLVLLIAANTALAAVTYAYVIPESDKLSRELNMTRGQISTKRAETDRLRNEFDEIQLQKARFENLQAAGFISDQNRLVARRRIIDIQKYTKVLRAGYNVQAADVLAFEEADAIKHVVLSTPITVDIDAMDDLDFYNFVYWMENAFPGHVSVTGIEMERVLDVNEATLRRIGSGGNAALVRGKANFVWRTMAPEDEVETEDDFSSGDF